MTLFWNPCHGRADNTDARGRPRYWVQRRDRPMMFRSLEDPSEQRILDLARAHGRKPFEGGLTGEESEKAIAIGALVDRETLPLEPPEFRVDLLDGVAPIDGPLAINGDLIWQEDERAPYPLEAHPRSHGGAISRDRPILWVKQPSGMHSPVWAGEHERMLRRIDREAPPPELIPALASHGILQREGEAERWRKRMEEQRARYARDRFAVIDGVHPAPLLAAFRRYAREMRAAGLYRIDVQQVKHRREGMYQEVASRLIHHLAAPAIGEVLGRAIQPSYCWFRRYLPGAKLEKHCDRPQCRWNVSMCFESVPDEAAREWPIHLEVGGVQHSVPLSAGEMVLYAGTEIPHWRGELPEERWISNFFFHFVEADFEGSLD